MIEPSIPSNESDRIAALHRYQILDTESEIIFDDIARLAAAICQTPISLISLVDTSRQWFKSHHGVDVNELSRKDAFCAHAINDPENMMIIPDSRLDERFHDNPIVVGDPNVVFYAGVPLQSPDGYPLGTLCIIDNQPRELADNQVNALKILANQVECLMELHLKTLLMKETSRIKLEEKNHQLQKSNQELLKKNNELEKLTFITTHDLKVPLNNINNFAKLIKQNKASSLDEEGKIFLDFILNSGQKLDDIINELLEYSLIGKANEYEWLDVHEIISHSLKELYHPIHNSSALIEVDNMPRVWGLKKEIESLFQNLISNSLKYTRPGTTPEIRITCVEKEGVFEFSITDNGMGFDAKYKDKIFVLFQRLHLEDEIPGTGIGLAQCKKIIDTHQGEIWAEASPGKGASFHFTIPQHVMEVVQVPA